MTLLEVTVTLAILGMLVLMLAGIFSSTVNDRQIVMDNVNMLNRGFGAMELLARDFEAMHVYDALSAGGSQSVSDQQGHQRRLSYGDAGAGD